jgi:hypothetical protein
MRFLLAAVLSIGLLLGTAVPATADGAALLEGKVAQATGISRTADAYLRQVAAKRSAEIVTTFAHRPMPELSGWSWGEVIAYNAGYADPYAQVIVQWRNSPSHWSVLTSGLPRIGCDHRAVGDRHYFVCIVGRPPVQPAPQPPPPAPQQPAPYTEIPNTALPPRPLVVDLAILLGQILVTAAIIWPNRHRFRR